MHDDIDTLDAVQSQEEFENVGLPETELVEASENVA